MNTPNNKPVIVKLSGGLGNQLFQYAAGRAVADRISRPLKIDASSLKKDQLRSYRLNHFSIRANFASDEEMALFFPFREKRRLDKWIIHGLKKRIRPWHARDVIRERFIKYDKAFEKIKSSCYLDGYWQSEKYFIGVEDLIRQEFRIKTEPSPENAVLLNMLENQKESVSVHIRRGDYVAEPSKKRLYGSITKEYYDKAIEVLQKEIQNPVFYFFSDDIDWVKEQFGNNLSYIFVDQNGPETDYEDLRLMRCCNHHIIANSTFSWWGAWLSENKNTRVIAPKNWFGIDRKIDIIPNRWETL